MTTQIIVTRDLDCNPNVFWKLFLDSAFMRDLFQHLGFARYEVIEVREEPGAIFRKSSGEPPLDAPGVVQKVLGPSFAYVENGTWDRATKTWSWTTTPSVLAERSQMTGRLRVDAIAQDKCRMTVEATVAVRMLGIGALIEATGERTIRSGWTRTAEYFASRIERGGLVPV